VPASCCSLPGSIPGIYQFLRELWPG